MEVNILLFDDFDTMDALDQQKCSDRHRSIFM